MRTDNTKAEWESEWEDCEITPLDKDTDQNEHFFFQEEIEDPEREAFETVNKTFKNLNKVGLGTQFHAFFSLIVENKFSLDNISMLLFLETVRFYDCDNTSQVRYLEETKHFWKPAYRLFHAIFCILWVVLNMLVSCPRLTQKAFLNQKMLGSILLCQV